MNNKYEKYIREDGKVAVLYSPGFGAGWYSWNTQYEGLAFDADLVRAVLADDLDEVVRIAKDRYPGAYLGGAEDLQIAWMNNGDCFEIDEYDGNESIHVIGSRSYLIA
jgi:hypothetical protein